MLSLYPHLENNDWCKMADWVFDSLVGYLQSPMWTYPVDSFLDHHCVVFDQGEENKFSYTDIHREYQTMVENLLESFMSDLGITPEMFTKACSQTGKLAEEHEVLFERILAADDFLAFKAIMVQRNIDLEQQALALLQKQLGHSPEVYQAEPLRVNKSEEEDSTLKKVLQQSKKEFDLQSSLEEEELERLIELAKEESLKLYQASQREHQEEIAEKMTLLSAVGTSERVVERSGMVTQQQQTSVLSRDEKCVDPKMEGANTSPMLAPATPTTSEVKQTDTFVPMKSEQRLCGRQSPSPPQTGKPATSMYPPPGGSSVGHSSHQRELTGSEAAAKWLESARSEVQQSTTYCSKFQEVPSPQDLKDRETYLKRQRDHLLEMKKKARAQEFDTYATSLSRSRSKSAQVAMSATRGELGQNGRKSSRNTGVLCTAITRKLKEQAAQEHHS